jgi:hypothetical protein
MSRLTKDFNEKASTFAAEYYDERMALEKCLESKVNDDINFVCKAPKEKYLKGIAMAFCRPEYDKGVKCQKDAGERWSQDCFSENVAFGQCADSALRKMFVYNLEHNKKNPSNVPTPVEAVEKK